MAPGVSIHTTTMGNSYTSIFNRTSCATPFVAGITPLMLSVHPNLTPAQIKLILRVTANDIGETGFDNDTGFGRANALQAIQSVYPSNCSENITITDPINDHSHFYQASYDITATNLLSRSITVGYAAGNTITLQPGFHVQNRASFLAAIGGCNDQSNTRHAGQEVVNTTTGSSVQLSSHPTQGIFKVELSADAKQVEDSSYKLGIYNLLGTLIDKREISPGKTVTIRLKNRPKGVYIVKCSNGQQTYTSKVVYH